MEKTASLFGAPGRSDVWNANRHYCHFRRKYITLMMTIIASTELILIQTMCSIKLRMDSIHNDKHITDRILLIRRVMLGAPSMWEIICKWSALWCCRVINKSSYQNEKWNFKNEEVSINLGHRCHGFHRKTKPPGVMYLIRRGHWLQGPKATRERISH